MSRLAWLSEFVSLLTSVLKWLDANFKRVFMDLREQCPKASDEWIADRVVTLATDWTFQSV